MRLQCGMYGPVKLGGKSKGEKRGSSSSRCGPLSVSFEMYGSFEMCVCAGSGVHRLDCGLVPFCVQSSVSSLACC